MNEQFLFDRNLKKLYENQTKPVQSCFGWNS